MTCTSLGGMVDTVTHLGGHNPKNTPKWAWIGIFKPNSQNIIATKYGKVTHLDPHNLSAVKTSHFSQSKMADSRHFEHQTINISQQRVNRSSWNLAWCCTL